MKKIITLIFLLVSINFIGKAQSPTIPTPPTDPAGDAADKKESLGINRGPIGTATALLFALGVSTVGYKIRRNKKEEKLS